MQLIRKLRVTVAVAGLCALVDAASAQSDEGFRPIDGGELDGRAHVPLHRLLRATYADRREALAGPDRPNPRAVSSAIFAQSGSLAEPSGASGFLFQWGQFLDHDLDLTPPHVPTESANIDVSGDPVFTGIDAIPFLRSSYAEGSRPREQLNEITAFIDASNVYGSDPTRAAALRRNDGTGELKTSQFDLLPYNLAGLPNDPAPTADFYLAGDVRANEQVGLTAMHTLFVREHNRQARALRALEPGLSGDEVYERVRARVGALMQVITYREFLPLLLGPSALPAYVGYDAGTDPGISNEFATAAYRFGHSAIQPVLHRLKANGSPIPEGPLSLREAFFTRNELNPNVGKGIEPLLRGLALVPSQKVDFMVVDDVRNFLFSTGDDATGIDLVALNIQRGRDHGLGTYQDGRKAAGLRKARQFSDISSDPEVVARLASVYASVDDVDLWVGGLCEERTAGGLVGPVFRYILRDQFRRLRDGDPFLVRARVFGSGARRAGGHFARRRHRPQHPDRGRRAARRRVPDPVGERPGRARPAAPAERRRVHGHGSPSARAPRTARPACGGPLRVWAVRRLRSRRLPEVTNDRTPPSPSPSTFRGAARAQLGPARRLRG